MQIKPIEGEEKKVEETVWVKIVFLITAVLLGSFIFNHYDEIRQKTPVASEVVTKNTNKTLQENGIDIEKTKSQLISYSKVKAEEVKGVVLGEANRRIVPVASELASKSAEMAQDYIYSHTVEEVIKKLIVILPERRQKELLDWMYHKN